MAFINGTNSILYILIDGGYLPIACLTENSMSETIDTIDTTTRDNEGWKTFAPTMQTINLSFSGLLINTAFPAGDFTKVSYDKLKQLKRDKTLISWKLETTDTNISESGIGYITSLSDTNAIDEFISFSGEITSSK